MRYRAALLALLAGLMAAVPAEAQREAHRHSGFLFQYRFTPDLNADVLYRAFLTDPTDPASLIVERGDGYLGDSARVDLRVAACPPLRRAVELLVGLPLPAIHLGEGAPYDARAPRGAHYQFGGFARFPNGGEGEVSFHAYDVPGGASDPQLDWMRGLVRAFEACREQAG